MATMPPKDDALSDSVLRIVFNRCRNLRKAIEKATVHERAMDCGKQVSPEQMESIKAKPVRQSLLHELEQILEKQTAIMKPEPPVLGKRAAKRLERAKNIAVVSNFPAAQGATIDLGKKELRELHSDDTNSNGKPDDLSEGHAGSSTNVADSESEKHSINDMQVNGDEKYEGQVEPRRGSGTYTASMPDMKASVQSIVEISHVVSFINQEGGRECISNYFSRATAFGGVRIVTDLDIDVLLYFYRMLSTPNGSVPHKEAVGISAEHCCAYLERSEEEAFSGTTYATLSEIVRAIAASPLLANRQSMPTTNTEAPLERANPVGAEISLSAQSQQKAKNKLPLSSTPQRGMSAIVDRGALRSHDQVLGRTQHSGHSELAAPNQLPVHNHLHYHAQSLAHGQIHVQRRAHNQMASGGSLPVHGQVQPRSQLPVAHGPNRGTPVQLTRTPAQVPAGPGQLSGAPVQLGVSAMQMAGAADGQLSGTVAQLSVAPGHLSRHGQIGTHRQIPTHLATHNQIRANSALPARQMSTSNQIPARAIHANGLMPTHNQRPSGSQAPIHNPVHHPSGSPSGFFDRKPVDQHDEPGATNPSSMVHEVVLLPRRY